MNTEGSTGTKRDQVGHSSCIWQDTAHNGPLCGVLRHKARLNGTLSKHDTLRHRDTQARLGEYAQLHRAQRIMRKVLQKICTGLAAEICRKAVEICTWLGESCISLTSTLFPVRLNQLLQVENGIEIRHRSKLFASETLRLNTYFNMFFDRKKEAFVKFTKATLYAVC